MKLPLVVLMMLVVPAVSLSDDDDDQKQLVGNTSEFSENTSFMVKLADIKQLIATRDYRTAAVELKQLSKSNEKNPEIWRLLGVAAHKKGDYLGSKIAFEKALKLNPDDKQSLGYQADLFLSIGDKQSARTNLQKLEELCPDGCDSRQRLATALDNI